MYIILNKKNFLYKNKKRKINLNKINIIKI